MPPIGRVSGAGVPPVRLPRGQDVVLPRRDGELDGPRIAASIGQIDSLRETRLDRSRCGAQSILVAAVLAGGGRLHQVALELARRTGTRADPRSAGMALAAAERLERGTATFADPSRLAEHQKQREDQAHGWAR